MAKELKAFGAGYHTSMLGGYYSSDVDKRATRLREMQAQLRYALNDLNHTDEDPIGLIGTGMSGMLLVPSLADMSKIPFLMVRQPGTTSPNGYPHTGTLFGLQARRLIFVDDLVASGGTLLNCLEAVTAHESTIVGVLVTSTPLSSMSHLSLDQSATSGGPRPMGSCSSRRTRAFTCTCRCGSAGPCPCPQMPRSKG